MRNMSFLLTTAQIIARTKWVTRRLGWGFLVPGEVVQGCEKCQGLGKGGKLNKLTKITVISTRWEPLDRMITEPEYGGQEVTAEGFPEMSPAEFVEFFCKSHRGCRPTTHVNRIHFGYVDEVAKP